MTSPLLHQKILCYLTPEANEAVAQMKQVGFDEDLAISILEQLWPETAIFELEAVTERSDG